VGGHLELRRKLVTVSRMSRRVEFRVSYAARVFAGFGGRRELSSSDVTAIEKLKDIVSEIAHQMTRVAGI
jgi:hypothetical protein